MRRSFSVIVLGLVCLASSQGCDTPAGRERIAYRQQRLAEQWRDRQKSEDSRPQRIQEAEEAVQRWHRMEVRRFEERLPTVGHFIF